MENGSFSDVDRNRAKTLPDLLVVLLAVINFYSVIFL